MNQAGESGRTIERFMLVSESLPANAKPFRLLWLTGAAPGIYGCFSSGVWTQLFAAGAVVLGGNAAPVDADVAVGQAVIYFVPTNGASYIGIKAKESDGTVVNAQVFTS